MNIIFTYKGFTIFKIFFRFSTSILIIYLTGVNKYIGLNIPIRLDTSNFKDMYI